MNSVDENVKIILKQLSVSQDIDKEKEAFLVSFEYKKIEIFLMHHTNFLVFFSQQICQNVDENRTYIKWLVQKHDMLSPYYPKISAAEHEKLQALMERYKSLLPVIETTITRTESISRCYLYKKEVIEVSQLFVEFIVVFGRCFNWSSADQVCRLVQGVREEIKSKPKSIENIEQMIVQQEEAVNLLNEQRSNVISMIQRGRELVKESDQTPEFVSELVSNLETEWKEAYSKTIENLNQLRGFCSIVPIVCLFIGPFYLIVLFFRNPKSVDQLPGTERIDFAALEEGRTRIARCTITIRLLEAAGR